MENFKDWLKAELNEAKVDLDGSEYADDWCQGFAKGYYNALLRVSTAYKFNEE